MIGDVSTRSVYLKDGVMEKASDRCQVLGVRLDPEHPSNRLIVTWVSLL